MSLVRDGKNLFEGDLTPDSEAGYFVAGILAHARAVSYTHLSPVRPTLTILASVRWPSPCAT